MTSISQNFFKLNTAVILGALVTLLLFYFMQYLIETESDRPQVLNITKIFDATMPEIVETLITEEQRPEPIVPEELPIVSQPSRESDLPIGLAIRLPETKVILEASPIGVTPIANNIMVPLIRTTAPYPNRALQRGVEGFVELSFTVDRFGSVVDPVVLNAVPEGYFERSALQAIRKWRYAAAVENGEPVATYDVRQRIVFQIDPSSR